VEDSRPEASADSASSYDTPRQRRIKLRVASSLGQPRPASASPGQPRPASAAGMFWLAGHARLVFHIGPQGIAKHGTTKTTLTSPLRMTRSRVGKSACQSPKGKSPRGLKQSHV
jgi:hypothetical protein